MGAKHVPLVGHLCEHTARLFSAKLKTIICLQEWQMVVTEASNCSAGHSEFVLLPMLPKSTRSFLPSVILNQYATSICHFIFRR